MKLRLAGQNPTQQAFVHSVSDSGSLALPLTTKFHTPAPAIGYHCSLSVKHKKLHIKTNPLLL